MTHEKSEKHMQRNNSIPLKDYSSPGKSLIVRVYPEALAVEANPLLSQKHRGLLRRNFQQFLEGRRSRLEKLKAREENGANYHSTP